MDDQDVNGWFVGFVETANNTYFFSTNIGADSDATGGNATRNNYVYLVRHEYLEIKHNKIG